MKQPAIPALVVGFSIHGLAVARALAANGVVVHALADEQSRRSPTSRTRFATLHFCRDLNGRPLANLLLEISEAVNPGGKLALFPTSDRIVKAIALEWDKLNGKYLLSWSRHKNRILELQRKDRIAETCERAGIRLPATRNILSPADCNSVAATLRFPLVVKPAQPLSSFKAIRVDDAGELRDCVTRFAADLPHVVQEWIDGPEPSLYSCTAYVDNDELLFAATTRKITAQPPGLGQGTVFETCNEPEVVEITRRFLGYANIAGPVAVEFKRDANGEFWLIEPNVGRSEYCVDILVQSGFNLPYIEYLCVSGRRSEVEVPAFGRNCVWYDTDKDPMCLFADGSRLLSVLRRRRQAVFPYFGHQDLWPFAASCWQQLAETIRAGSRRIARIARGLIAGTA